jgi:hypothetical protein
MGAMPIQSQMPQGVSMPTSSSGGRDTHEASAAEAAQYRQTMASEPAADAAAAERPTTVAKVGRTDAGIGLTIGSGDPWTMMQNLFEKAQGLSKRLSQIQADVNAGKLPESALQTAQGEMYAELLTVQIQMQRTAMGAELLSKVVEHATSGVRTVLQTQT